MKKITTWRKYLIQKLAENQEEAIHLLDAMMEEYYTYGNTSALLSAVSAVVEAQGGISELAKRTHMSPDALMKILSSDKAPHIDTLATILKALGCRLSITPIASESPTFESDASDQRTSAAG